MRPARIAMALYGDLTFDSRVRREATTLADDGYEVTIVCLADGSDRTDLEGIRVVVEPLGDDTITPGATNPFRSPAMTRVVAVLRGVRWLWRYARRLRAWGRAAVRQAGEVDMWHLHDFTALAAVSPALGSARPFVYDVHDLMLETGTAVRVPRPLRELLRGYERRLASVARAIVTVNAGLGRRLQRAHPATPLVVVHNCPPLWTPSGPSLLRDQLGLSGDVPLTVYHGSLTGGRGIDVVMEAVLTDGLESVHLALLGFGPDRRALEVAANDVRWSGRVHVVDAVPPNELLSWIQGADIGVVLHSAELVNDRLKTPNKLFELLAAGVPILGSDLPAMREIVLADPAAPLGVLCDPSSVDGVARAMRGFLAMPPVDREAMRRRCLDAARTRWNWESEAAALSGLYRGLVSLPDPSRG